MKRSGETEYQHAVTGPDVCVTVNQQPLAVTEETGQSQFFRQWEVLHRRFGDLRPLSGLKFGDFSIGKRQTLRGRRVGIEQELENRTRCKQFLVHYSTDIKIFGL